MELLKNLYSIHSMSGHENAMRKFIKNYVKENVPGATVVQENKNLYITKGEADTYPCVVAHLDQVQTKHSRDFRVLELDGRLFGFSAENARQEGLGADDKNGIWVAIKCLERFDAIKVALFHSEEVGTVGSGEAKMSFFNDCRFVLEADRRNGGDLITDIWGSICSKAFLDDISDIRKRYGYKETSGMLTDVETLSDNGLGLSCVNISCGYYNPHTDQEYTVVDELYNCLAFVCEIIDNCKEVYYHKRAKSYGTYGGSYYGNWWKNNGYGYGYGYGKKHYNDYDEYDDDEVGVGHCVVGTASVSSPKKDDDEPKTLTLSDDAPEDIEVVNFNDYPTPEDAIYAFCYFNANWSPDDLWYYIEADCETYGFDYGDFIDIYDQVIDTYIDEDSKAWN